MLLRAWRAGDHSAFNELARLIYDELHRLAAFHLRGEYRNHGLRPTELVSEVYLRLVSNEPLEFIDRGHFFATVSRSMRRILVDHARKRAAAKRGSGDAPMEFDENAMSVEPSWELTLLDDALKDLARRDERKARVIELHYFGGMTQAEIAVMCGIHVNTVFRDLRSSEAWLRQHLHSAG